MIDDAELEKRFLYHPPTDAAKWRHAAISSLTLELAKRLTGMIPACRQLSLAMTHLEEVRMWSNAAVACNHELLMTDRERPS